MHACLSPRAVTPQNRRTLHGPLHQAVLHCVQHCIIAGRHSRPSTAWCMLPFSQLPVLTTVWTSTQRGGHARHACACHRCSCLHSCSSPHSSCSTPTRSLGYLVNRNRAEQLQEVVADLCAKLTGSSKEQVRDVASLGLKTVVAGALAGGGGGRRSWCCGGVCCGGRYEAACQAGPSGRKLCTAPAWHVRL